MNVKVGKSFVKVGENVSPSDIEVVWLTEENVSEYKTDEEKKEILEKMKITGCVGIKIGQKVLGVRWTDPVTLEGISEASFDNIRNYYSAKIKK